MTFALIALVSLSQTFIVNGRVENAKGKTKVVLYEFSGTKWDTAYIGYSRKFLWIKPKYSVVLDPDYKYQIWFVSSKDSVKVLGVDKKATTARWNIVDVDFEWKGCAVMTNGKRPFKLVQIDVRMTSANRPEDFEQKKAQIINKQ